MSFKYIQATSRLRVPSHRQAIESGRWARPNRIPVDERTRNECGVLEDEYVILELNTHPSITGKDRV